MSYETQVYKNLRGHWQAETFFPIPEIGPLVSLQLLTMKRFSGELVSSAKCVKLHDSGLLMHAWDDYAVGLIRNKNARSTEKNVRVQHDEALGLVDDVIALAIKHYKTQSAA